ncbi:MAG: hypothetical protein COX91_00915 [Candidatus Nealsonbacteria bacterium CG_4_10_14_0_2_um_filter_39_15]|uniref:Uncharacterized protein n=1 Tax=Candidatus Nealsonbacteria bacterium CG_4_10_14_0_2_um_filter_39_15 TaxID=1974681 RepID=A0A2M7UWF0_9BACT|nr:MAG: hypothetical protein COX91_00915 [Candidatus Nealsonbacteria bacterium CG_4_10_14_0_2_um_filter_39_15]
MKMPHHVLSADQFNPEILEIIFEEAERIRKADAINSVLLEKPLQGKIIPLLFWEASTRTFISSFNAVVKLGGTPVPVLNAGKFSSVTKGETLEDTIRTCADLKADAIVMRHSEAGSAQMAADILDRYAPWVHLFNAGDGKGEHPTQMGLDIYTIWRNKKEVLKKGELVVALAGELSDSRVFHSDAKVLIKWGVKKFILVSEKGNDLPDDILAEAEKKRIPYIKTTDILEYAEEPDVWIFTRLQLERKKVLGKILKIFPFLRPWVRRRYNQRFGMTKKLQARMKSSALAMHPLPRVGDMPEWMDEDERAVYLSRGKDTESQVTNGLYFRTAQLKLTLAGA